MTEGNGAAGLLSELTFVDEPPIPEHYNILLYGPTGAGKSTAAATAPGPLMWLNAEGPGALAYPRKVARQRGTALHEIRLEKGDPRPTLRAMIRHLRAGAEPRPETIVVDTLGKLRELLIGVLVVPGARNSMQQFGEVARVLKGFLLELRDMPVNLVIIAHEDISDVESERIVRPLIGGTLTEYVPSEMDVVGYCSPYRDDGGRVRYGAQLLEGRGRRAKDRSGGLGAFRDLDLSDWLVAYRAALAAEPAQESESVPV